MRRGASSAARRCARALWGLLLPLPLLLRLHQPACPRWPPPASHPMDSPQRTPFSTTHPTYPPYPHPQVKAKSRYEEDVLINNHTAVWGSWWHDGQWCVRRAATAGWLAGGLAGCRRAAGRKDCFAAPATRSRRPTVHTHAPPPCRACRGYACCHSSVKQSYCVGAAGRQGSKDAAEQLAANVERAAAELAEKREKSKLKDLKPAADVWGEADIEQALDQEKVKEALRRQEEVRAAAWWRRRWWGGSRARLRWGAAARAGGPAAVLQL